MGAFNKNYMLNLRDDKLRDTHSPLDNDDFRTMINKYDLYFSAIVGVDGSRSIEDCDAMMNGEAGTRSDLTFAARW